MTVPGYLAVDSGGSGLRVAVGVPGQAPSARRASGEPVRTGARGIDPDHLMGQLVPLARASAAEAGVDELATAVVGSAGFSSLGDALRAELPGALARELGVRNVALAADAVTAYVGALGPRPGAVVAAATGVWNGCCRNGCGVCGACGAACTERGPSVISSGV
ncbi:hypothetical protein ACFW9W_36895, partial [Streptomyces sp. NPDC059468]